jgi:subtilisin family serine protease
VALAVVVGLLSVGVAGSVAGDGTTLDETAVVETQDPSAAAVDSSLVGASGEREVLVELPERERAVSASQLRTHAARSQTDIRRLAQRTDGLTVVNQFWLTNAVLVRVDTDRVPPRALARIDGVESVQRNAEIPLLDSPSVAGNTTAGQAATPTAAPASAPTAGSGPATTYGVDQIDAPEVWSAYDTRGGNTSVEVLDTGVDPSHPDIDLAKWAEFDSEGNSVDTQPQDYGPSGHGTHASGTVVGGNASGRYIGVAPNATLYHGAVLTDCSNGDCIGTLSQIIAGMQWAVDQNADVLSMSLGANGYYSDFIDPVQNAQAAGTTVVAAVGNRKAGNSSSPANVYDAISVGAADRNRNIESFSSGDSLNTLDAWGPTAPPDWPLNYTVPTVAAAGSLVKSASPGGGYTEKSGTSMATPHVAGAVALAQSATDERLSPEELESGIEAAAAKPSGWSQPEDERDTRYGRGIVNAPGTIVAIRGPSAQFVSDPATPQVETNATLDAANSTGTIEQYAWDFDDDGNTDRTTTDPTTAYTFADPGRQSVTLTVTDNEGRNGTVTRNVSVQLPPVVDKPPRDPDGDGLYGDVRGDGDLSVLDVQALFNNLDNPAVQNNAASFKFSGTGGDVSVLDVQELFNEL